MYQPQPPDPDDLEQLGQPIYQGDGLQVRGLTEKELAASWPPTRSTGGYAPPSWPTGAAASYGGSRWPVAPASPPRC
jgi:hypothetical protein